MFPEAGMEFEISFKIFSSMGKGLGMARHERFMTPLASPAFFNGYLIDQKSDTHEVYHEVYQKWTAPSA